MASCSKKEIRAESTLNRDGDYLPYGYTNPETDGKLTWMCGYDAEGKITSVFSYDHGHEKEKQCQYLLDIEKAKYIRDELVKAGWIKIKGPNVTFTLPDGSESNKLTRKQKRYLEKKMKNLNKQNPFGAPENNTSNNTSKK